MTIHLDFAAARAAVAPFVINTPLLLDPWLTSRVGRDTYLKLENLQTTGSFKVRGAANHIVNLTHVKGMRRYDERRLSVSLADGTTLVASRSGSQRLRELMD